MFVFAFLIIVLIIILFSSLIVGNYNDVVFYNLNSNKLNGFRFLFVRVR